MSPSHILTLSLGVLNENLPTVYFCIQNNNNKTFNTYSKQETITSMFIFIIKADLYRTKLQYMHKIAHVCNKDSHFLFQSSYPLYSGLSCIWKGELIAFVFSTVFGCR
jgi:hypothetical protein